MLFYAVASPGAAGGEKPVDGGCEQMKVQVLIAKSKAVKMEFLQVSCATATCVVRFLFKASLVYLNRP